MFTVIVHINGFEGIINPLSDLLWRYSEVFGAECNILLNNACNKLVVGILKYKSHFFSYVICLVFI